MKFGHVELAALLAVVVAGVTCAGDIKSEFVTSELTEDGKPVRFELLVQKPDGPGPFPTVIFNHGSTGRGDDQSLFRRSWSSPAAAKYFVDKGWLIIFPQRRGRGASDGRYDEGFEPDHSRYSCRTNLSLAGVERAIEDLDQVMQQIKRRPDVRADQMLIAGQSRGGALAVAYAGERSNTFVGVINFVGGWTGEFCSNAVEINTTTFKRGAKFAGRTLWLYGDQDAFYMLRHSKANFDAFVSAGGKGSFLTYRVPSYEGSHLVLRFPQLWANDVAAYLESIKSAD